MAVGFAAVIIIKKAVRSLPVVGGVAKPLLGGWLQQQDMRGAQGCCCEAPPARDWHDDSEGHMPGPGMGGG